MAEDDRESQYNLAGKIIYDSTKILDESIGKVPVVGRPFIELNKTICDAGMDYMLPVSCAAVDDVAKDLNKQILPSNVKVKTVENKR